MTTPPDAPRSYTIGVQRRKTTIVPRVVLAGRWLDDAGFHYGKRYGVERVADGLLLRTGGYLPPPRHAPVMPSYESWMVRLHLERAGTPPAEPCYINGPGDAHTLMRRCATADRESLATVLLGTRNQVLGVDVTTVGRADTLAVQPRDVYKAAVHANAASIVLTHAHPGSDAEPGIEDTRIARRVGMAGEVLGITLLDYLVLGTDAYVSLRERGYF